MSSSQFKCRRDVIYDMKLRIRGLSVMGRRCGVVRSVGPIARHSQRDEIASDCRIDLMSDHWPLLVAEPLDGERLVNSQLRPRAGAVAIGRHDYSAALGPQELVHFLARVG